ncbi:MAG: Gfo/Idh/MocA family protein [Limnochordia bacterium]
MKRIALVGGAGAYHGGAFASLYNGFSEEKYKEMGWAGRGIRRRVEGAQIVKIWDESKQTAEALAAACDIPEVCDNLEEAAEGIDGVIITDDMTMAHQRRAPFFLQKGVPTLIDKPLSPDPTEAKELIKLARAHGTLLLSSSALRYAQEVEELKSELDQLGPIALATTMCGGDLVYYGIHALELAYSVMGPGVESLISVGNEEKADIVRLRYSDGRQLVLMVGRRGVTASGFQLTVHGSKRSSSIQVRDSGYFYWNLHCQFVQMIETGQLPVPLEETLEIITVLAEAKSVRGEERPISINLS